MTVGQLKKSISRFSSELDDTEIVFTFNKDGNYVGQYVLPSNIGDPKDITINFKTQKIYVLSDSFIYQFDL